MEQLRLVRKHQLSEWIELWVFWRVVVAMSDISQKLDFQALDYPNSWYSHSVWTKAHAHSTAGPVMIFSRTTLALVPLKTEDMR
jgi:hypothetical protein